MILRLSPWQRLVLAIKGRVRLRYEKRTGWVRPMPIYLCRCDKHGLYTDYPHGYKEETECPVCLEERVRRFAERLEAMQR